MGEARPRFWLSPTIPFPPAPPIISVAWTQQEPHEVEHQQQQQLEEMQQLQQQEQQQQQQQGISRIAYRLKSMTPLSSTTRSIRWPKNLKGSSHLSALPGLSDDAKSEGSVIGRSGNCLTIRAYPPFLMPYVDKVLRLRLVFTDPMVEQLVGEYSHLRHGSHDDDVDAMMEISHLVRNVHSLKVQFRHR
ncbi:hypothetical protein PoB_006136300 [Plakobranchus ocellatus]|uniref:Uncharacterized protein n=1 Tax=Plakobranchus ocellatus TaxID=259542 RepID=A0AAV4CSE9_9GAST|nr:hypothetical protein PoB_006136300 [Plakobranchus ocellatus]